MQSYFIDQKYQYLKSKSLAKDAEKEKTFEYEKYQMNNKKGLRKRDIANTRIHKNGKVQLRRGKANIVRVKNPKTKLQKIRKKHTIISVYANEILQKKLNCKKWKDNVKAEKIFKRYVYLRKIANL